MPPLLVETRVAPRAAGVPPLIRLHKMDPMLLPTSALPSSGIVDAPVSHKRGCGSAEVVCPEEELAAKQPRHSETESSPRLSAMRSAEHIEDSDMMVESPGPKRRSVSFSLSEDNRSESPPSDMETLLDSPNAMDVHRLTPLMLAARAGDVDLTRRLLTKGADARILDERGYDALMYAVRDGHEGVARVLLLGNGCEDPAAASNRSKPEMLPSALDGSAGDDGTRGNGKRALFVDVAAAASAPGLPPPQQLTVQVRSPTAPSASKGLNHGEAMSSSAARAAAEAADATLCGDLDRRAKFGFSHMMYAAMNGHDGCIVLLERSSAASASASAAVALGSAKVHSVNAPDSSGFTPLMGAAQNGHASTVELLLHLDADVDQRDASGMTALAFAAANGMTETVRALLRSKANVDLRDNKGRSPLLWAVAKKHQEVGQLLLAEGATVCDAVRLHCMLSHLSERNHDGQQQHGLAAAAVAAAVTPRLAPAAAGMSRSTAPATSPVPALVPMKRAAAAGGEAPSHAMPKVTLAEEDHAMEVQGN